MLSSLFSEFKTWLDLLVTLPWVGTKVTFPLPFYFIHSITGVNYPLLKEELQSFIYKIWSTFPLSLCSNPRLLCHFVIIYSSQVLPFKTYLLQLYLLGRCKVTFQYKDKYKSFIKAKVPYILSPQHESFPLEDSHCLSTRVRPCIHPACDFLLSHSLFTRALIAESFTQWSHLTGVK